MSRRRESLIGGPRLYVETRDPGRRRSPINTWLVVLVAGLAVFLADLAIVLNGSIQRTDRSAELSVHHTLGPATYGFFKVITSLDNNPQSTVFLIFVLLVLLGLRRWWSVLVSVVVVIGGTLVDTLVKVLVARPRPHLFHQPIQANGYSFPSGHSVGATTLLLLVGFLTWHVSRSRGLTAAVTVVCMGLAGLIGLSRVVLGVHWPSDVVGGFALGSAWLAAMVLLFGDLLRREG